MTEAENLRLIAERARTTAGRMHATAQWHLRDGNPPMAERCMELAYKAENRALDADHEADILEGLVPPDRPWWKFWSKG